MAPGDACGAGMKFLGLASQLSQTINLHRDPDRFPGEYDVRQAEERRRLFWQLHAFVELAASTLGAMWSSPSPVHIDTRLPADAHDVDVTSQEVKAPAEDEETMMTSILMRIQLAQISRRIVRVASASRMLTKSRPTAYSASMRCHIARCWKPTTRCVA